VGESSTSGTSAPSGEDHTDDELRNWGDGFAEETISFLRCNIAALHKLDAFVSTSADIPILQIRDPML
jgi:hypothetical protein